MCVSNIYTRKRYHHQPGYRSPSSKSHMHTKRPSQNHLLLHKPKVNYVLPCPPTESYYKGGKLISKSSPSSATLPTTHLALACISNPGIPSLSLCICKCSMKLLTLPNIGAPLSVGILHPLPFPSAQQNTHPNVPKDPLSAVGPPGMFLLITWLFARNVQRYRIPPSDTRTRVSKRFSALPLFLPGMVGVDMTTGPSKEHFAHCQNGIVPVRPAGRLATERAFLLSFGLGDWSLTAPLQKPWRADSVGRVSENMTLKRGVEES